MTTLLVGLAAGLGAVLRVVVDGAVTRRTRATWPAGTLAVNATGSLALGLLSGSVASSGLRAVIGVGLLGGYTTFSTWAWETISLADSRRPAAALGNVVASTGLGLAGAALGLALTR